jgi:UDP-2,4-diacetamido-2,4,6-trideoxy-beta-L-altropyranose hydrolase
VRCMTFAEALVGAGIEVSFVLREPTSAVTDQVQSKGFKFDVIRAANEVSDAEQTIRSMSDSHRNVDWVVVDHYGLDKEWEQIIRKAGPRVLAVDDLEDRVHGCDALVNPAPEAKGGAKPDCQLFLGTRYFFLRDQFRSIAKRSRAESPVKNLLVMFGGSDLANHTEAALDGVEDIVPQSTSIDTVVGRLNPHLETIRKRLNGRPRFRLHVDLQNVAELMNSADISIGAGGSTAWERCFLGLPSIAVVAADNQARSLQALSSQGAVTALVCASRPANAIKAALMPLLNDPERRHSMSAAAFQATQDLGTGIKDLIAFMKRNHA